MSYVQPQPRPSIETLRASIADADDVLAWAAANPAQAGSLAAHTLGITKSVRDHAVADLATRELLDRIMAGRKT